MSVSQFLLTWALHIFLLNQADDPNLSVSENQKLHDLKKLIYHSSYVNNLFLATDKGKELAYSHDNTVRIFNNSQFPLQQFMTSDLSFQSKLDHKYQSQTPQ